VLDNKNEFLPSEKSQLRSYTVDFFIFIFYFDKKFIVPPNPLAQLMDFLDLTKHKVNIIMDLCVVN
jgi:hypothetical protein